jgi:NADH:ubiquinone oxidoreductase subunit D
MDIGLFTCFLWGFEEREKLINYIESISGSRLHNALLAVNNIGIDIEKPSLNIMVIMVL